MRNSSHTKKRKRPLKERNRVHIGIIGTLLVFALLVVIFNYKSIPGVSSAAGYKAEFAEASGLTTKDDVQIAGMVVGRVTSIELSGDHVVVEFDADTDGVDLGERTGAAIKVGTILGKRFVELVPDGDGTLSKGSTIPLERTTSGFDITQSLSQVTDTVAKTDKVQLSNALDTTAGVLAQLSPHLQESLTGLTRLSQTVSSRDQAIGDLLKHTNGVTEVLSHRNEQFALLLTDGQSLFRALNERADTIHRVLVQAKSVFDELNALAQENRTALSSTLDQLSTTLVTLNKNYDNINEAIKGLRGYTTQIKDVIGSGPFFNVLLENITPANLNGQQPSSPGAPR